MEGPPFSLPPPETPLLSRSLSPRFSRNFHRKSREKTEGITSQFHLRQNKNPKTDIINNEITIFYYKSQSCLMQVKNARNGDHVSITRKSPS